MFAWLENEEADLNEMFEGGIEAFLEEWRFNLRGEVLYYCVVDETANLSDRVRYQIDKSDRDIMIETYGRDKEQYTVEQYRESISTYSQHYQNYPKLSRNRFRELEEPFYSVDTLNTWLQQDKIAGYFVLPKGLANTNNEVRFVQTQKVGIAQQTKLDSLKSWYENMITRTLREHRFQKQNVNTEQLEELMVQVSIDIVSLNDSINAQTLTLANNQESTKTSTVSIVAKITSIPYIALLALVWGGGSYLILTSSIEEKTSKVGEILFSSVDPLSLMDGKVLGNVIVVGIGLGAWLVIIGFPSMLILSDSVLLYEVLAPIKILNFILFGSLAFASFGYLNAALGSACSDIKDTMYVNQPFALIGFFVVLPMLVYVLLQPESSFASIMSFVPPLTPLFMVARAAALPDLPTYLLIVFIASISLVVIRHISVKIFISGLLLERKIVSLGSLYRLVRQPE